MKKRLRLSGMLLLLAIPFLLTAQSPEQKVRTAANEINAMMEELHQLARQKNVEGAIAKLDEINAAYKKEIQWETFSKEYRNVKMSNPSFDYEIRTDLPAQLDPQFWKDYQQRCDGIMADQDQAVEGFTAMVQLNNYDKMMAYGAQLKNTYETFKNAAENLGTANLPKFAYDLHGNMNDFVENYKKIEKAEVEGIDIQTYKMDFNRMMSRARRSKDLYNQYQRFITSNIMAINTYNANVKYIKDLKTDASSGPLKPLEPSLDYIWNYESFEEEIIDACEAMEHYEVKCAKLKSDIDAIKSEARRDWSRVKGNIYSSDDEAQKPMYIKDCEEAWAAFFKQANELYIEAYELYCQDNSADSSDSNNSNNAFDGSSASGTATMVEDSSDEKEEVHTSTDNFNPNNGTFIGTISAGGGHGAYAAIEIMYLQDSDKIVFKKVSGTLKHVQLIWRKQGGSWETAYEGPKTEFTIGNGIGKMPPGTTHLNFVVNANHNRWSVNDVPCKMDVYLVSGGGSGSSASTSSQSDSGNENEDSNSNPSSESNSSNNGSGGSVDAPENSSYLGEIYKRNQSGNSKKIQISKIEKNDEFTIVPVSGEVKWVQLSWLTRQGELHKATGGTNLYVFSLGTVYNRPENATHIVVEVNGAHNNFKNSNPDCEAKVYLVDKGGGPLYDPYNSSNNDTQTKKETPSNTVNKEFNELIKKANESFNKPYWEEGQGPKASSNPKQESLNYLAKASRLINREPSIETKFSMVQQLVSTSTRFAQRVHAYEAKIPFINLAGQTVSRASGQVSSIQATETKSKEVLQKYAYGKIASSWRAVRDATLVHGGTNYNKESCDREYVKYKELSER